jgi:hypothetical protein
MPRDTHILSSNDPLRSYAHAAVISGTQHPVPLTATAIKVRVDGLLATVTTSRTFRNVEERTIEATMSFPAPVHATLLSLEASIDGRTLKGSAKRREAARQTYEAALDSGKTSVLHEEVLRGVHMISVGHVGPGKEVTVTGTWAMPLSASGNGALLRIPVTVGEVYGRSPLADSDDLAYGGAVQEAELEVSCSQGHVHLQGGKLVAGRTRVRLDAPVDLELTGMSAGMLRGVAADGRPVALDIRAAGSGDLVLDASIMMDRSGSMQGKASGLSHEGSGNSLSKLDVAHAGLRHEAGCVKKGDRVDLWQFDDDAERIAGRDFGSAVANMTGTQGGTQVGRSLRQVLAARKPRDILLVTDGKSHDLDVHEIAQSGCRINVVLVGEDSLEANVGHLAALTGGQVFIAAGNETAEALRMAFAAMRRPVGEAHVIKHAPDRAEAVMGGMLVRAAWGDAVPCDGISVVGIVVPTMIEGTSTSLPAKTSKAPSRVSKSVEPSKNAAEGRVIEGVQDALLSRSVAAVAAALALPRMSEEEAGALAEAEGIVCHLTSLVLVDEEGEAQEGIPAQRKVAGMTPRTSGMMFASSASSFASQGMMRSAGASLSASSNYGMSLDAGARSLRGAFIGGRMAERLQDMGIDTGISGRSGTWKDTGSLPPVPGKHIGDGGTPTYPLPGMPTLPSVPACHRRGTTVPADLKLARGGVDWSSNPQALSLGDLRGVSGCAAEAFVAAAKAHLLVALAAKLGTTAMAIAVALLARDESAGSRAAGRIARIVLAKAEEAEVEQAARSVGL